MLAAAIKASSLDGSASSRTPFFQFPSLPVACFSLALVLLQVIQNPGSSIPLYYRV